MNGVDTNNLFNGNSTSKVGENRFVLNTGEKFGAGGTITDQHIGVYARSDRRCRRRRWRRFRKSG